MEILHLTLKKKWFDMIRSGEKLEEYREIKQYWIDRLYFPNVESAARKFKKYDAIKFTNGYSKNAPSFMIELKSIKVDFGKSKWGAEPRTLYFVLSLGDFVVFLDLDDENLNSEH